MAAAHFTSAPTLALDEATTFLYPKDERYAFRAYQHACVSAAFQQNLLVSLPTGTGKTLVAAVVLHNFLRWFPDGLVIFMATTRPLVQQQLKACCRCVGLPQHVAQVLTGEDGGGGSSSTRTRFTGGPLSLSEASLTTGSLDGSNARISSDGTEHASLSLSKAHSRKPLRDWRNCAHAR